MSMRNTLLSSVVLFHGFAAIVPAQITTGQIQGTVLDAQGASIPGARIGIQNDRTGQTATVESGENGLYLVRSLPVGRYTVAAEHQGFKKFVRSGIELGANQVLRLDIDMQLGAVTESVNVTANLSPVNTTTSTVDSVIDTKQVNDLPLNGRNILSLAGLSAGVTRTSLADGVSFDQQRINVNGNRSYSTNVMLDGASMYYAHRGQALLNPPPDAIQEVRVITSGVSAEFSRGSAVISAVTKSGANELHGSAWDYLRNDLFDARSFFATTVPKLRYNQFGGAAGGPAVRNKAFFFGSYQGLKQRADVLRSAAFPPTDAERAGDFSRTRGRPPLDPSTRTPFPGARIPVSRFDPVAQKIAAKIPLPNQADGRYINQLSAPVDSHSILGRGDWDVTSRDRSTFRYFIDSPSAANPFGRGDVAGYGGNITRDRGQNLTGSHSHTFSSSMLLNARFGWTRFLFEEIADTTETIRDLGSNLPLGAERGAPSPMLVSGRFQAYPARESERRSRTHEGGVDLSWVRGRHEIKFGGALSRVQYGSPSASVAYGIFSFDGAFSDNALADFLIGTATSLEQAKAITSDSRYWSYGLYVQDNWRASRKLTLNLGLRWEIYQPWRSHNGFQAAYVPGARSRFIPEAPAGMVYDRDPEFPFRRDALNPAPRAGFAYDLFGNGRTSIRGGYALSYDPLTSHQGGGSGAQPFGLDASTSNVGPLVDPRRFSPVDFSRSGADSRVFTFPVSIGKSFLGTMRTPYAQNISLNVEQQVAPETLLRVGYVSSLGRRLPYVIETNPAVFVPGQSATTNTDRRRPLFPTFRSILADENGGNSAYHALQIEARKRYSAGFLFSVAYSYGKAIDDVTTSEVVDNALMSNPDNRRLDRGLGNFDVRQRVSASWLWELPVFRGQSSLAARMFGGWQFGGVMLLQDGGPFSVSSGRDQSLRGIGLDRPNLLGDPRLDSGRAKSERLARYFDTSQFRLNEQGRFGNAGRNILNGPGGANFNLSLHKSFAVRERQRVEFRTELFNAFNRASFGNPGANLNNQTNFGRITAAGAGRIMQLALRYEF